MAGRALKRVALINDTSAWYHWGCTCTSTAIHDHLDRLGYTTQSVPIHDIYTAGHFPSTLHDFDSPEFFRKFMSDGLPIFQKLDCCEHVLINGEGTIHGLSANVLKLLYIAYAAKRFLGKNVQLINHSGYPENRGSPPDPLARAVYKKVYSVLDYVAVREEISAGILRDLGLRVARSFDCLPLFIQSHYCRDTAAVSNVITFSGSAQFSDPVTAAPFLCLMERISQEGYPVAVLTGARAHPAVDDKRFIEQLKEGCRCPWTLIEATTPGQWLDVIASSRLFISGRFHHSIAAAFLGTPFIMVDANTSKLDALANELGCSPPLPMSAPDLQDALYEATVDVLSDVRENHKIDGAILHRLIGFAFNNFSGLESADPVKLMPQSSSGPDKKAISDIGT
jgi:polysaccharide pyruvyl transferase WcaK-like protein